MKLPSTKVLPSRLKYQAIGTTTIITIISPTTSSVSNLAAYALNAFTVGVGELIACVILGQLLLTALPKVPVLRPFIPEHRLANI